MRGPYNPNIFRHRIRLYRNVSAPSCGKTHGVNRCGRTFLRRLIDLLKGAQRFRPFLRLDKQCQLDIAWWQEFLPSWDGVYFFDLPNWAPSPDISLSSDAAGSLGFGGGGETMANDSMVHGSHRSNPYASRIRNCSRLF